MTRESILPAGDAAARNTSNAQGVMGMVGGIVSYFPWRELDSAPLRAAQWATILTGLAVLLAVRIAHRRWTARIGSVVFILNVIPVGALAWFSNTALSGMNRFWEPFLVYELMSLSVAIIAPRELWAGLLAIVSLVLTAVAQFFVLPESTRVHMPLGAPWGAVGFGLLALVMLLFRVRGRVHEAEAARAVEETRSLRRLAQLVVAVRDLANSPIQALLLDTALIVKHPEDHRRIIPRISRSVARLRRLNELLDQQTPDLEPEPGDESLDSVQVLRGEVASEK